MPEPRFATTAKGPAVPGEDGRRYEVERPDAGRVAGVCPGGPRLETLFAFCGGRVWKRLVKLHAIGPFPPWIPVSGSPL
jgi:gluconolactonase